MRIFRWACLTAVLCYSTGCAAAWAKGLDQWAIHHSVNEIENELNDAWTDAATIVNYALDKLQMVSKKMTNDKKAAWQHAAKSFILTFGVALDEEKPKAGALDLAILRFRVVNDILQGKKVNLRGRPPRGYHEGMGALIVYGNDAYTWVDKTVDKNKEGSEARKASEILGNAGQWMEDKNPDGGWLVTNPLRLVQSKADLPMCPDGVLAAVVPQADLFQICPFAVSLDLRIQPSPVKKKEQNLKSNDLTFPESSFAVTIIHELFHWVSFDTKTQSPGIKDLPAVDDAGKDIDGIEAYGLRYVANMARFKPQSSLKNADSYTTLALALYLDLWDWTSGKGIKYKS